jgi:hypothetical protein
MPSFDNPDFVDVAIHSYRHRFGLAPGAAEYEDDERFLAGPPTIASPAIVLDPTDDPTLATTGPARRAVRTPAGLSANREWAQPAVRRARGRLPLPCATYGIS